MNDVLSEFIKSTPAGLRLWHQERLVLEATERLCELMESQGVTRKELAERIDRTEPRVSRLLDDEAPITLRAVCDMFLALGREVHVIDKPIEGDHPNG